MLRPLVLTCLIVAASARAPRTLRSANVLSEREGGGAGVGLHHLLCAPIPTPLIEGAKSFTATGLGSGLGSAEKVFAVHVCSPWVHSSVTAAAAAPLHLPSAAHCHCRPPPALAALSPVVASGSDASRAEAKRRLKAANVDSLVLFVYAADIVPAAFAVPEAAFEIAARATTAGTQLSLTLLPLQPVAPERAPAGRASDRRLAFSGERADGVVSSATALQRLSIVGDSATGAAAAALADVLADKREALAGRAGNSTASISAEGCTAPAALTPPQQTRCAAFAQAAALRQLADDMMQPRELAVKFATSVMRAGVSAATVGLDVSGVLDAGVAAAEKSVSGHIVTELVGAGVKAGVAVAKGGAGVALNMGASEMERVRATKAIAGHTTSCSACADPATGACIELQKTCPGVTGPGARAIGDSSPTLTCVFTGALPPGAPFACLPAPAPDSPLAGEPDLTNHQADVFSTAFIYGLLTLRSLRIREVLQHASLALEMAAKGAEAQASVAAKMALTKAEADLKAGRTKALSRPAPAVTAEILSQDYASVRQLLKEILAKMPASQADPFFADAVSAAKLQGEKEKWKRLIVRGIVAGAVDGTIAAGTHGVSTMVTAGLVTAGLPSPGQAVADLLVRSPVTAHNFAVIDDFVELYQSVITRLLPLMLRLPRYKHCGFVMDKVKDWPWSDAADVARAREGEWRIQEILKLADFERLPACAFLSSFVELLHTAVEDAATLRWVAYERSADHYAGPLKALRVLQEVVTADACARTTPDVLPDTYYSPAQGGGLGDGDDVATPAPVAAPAMVDRAGDRLERELTPSGAWQKADMSGSVHFWHSRRFFFQCFGADGGEVRLVWRGDSAGDDAVRNGVVITRTMSYDDRMMIAVGLGQQSADILTPHGCNTCPWKSRLNPFAAPRQCLCVHVNRVEKRSAAKQLYTGTQLNLIASDDAINADIAGVFNRQLDEFRVECNKAVAVHQASAQEKLERAGLNALLHAEAVAIEQAETETARAATAEYVAEVAARRAAFAASLHAAPSK